MALAFRIACGWQIHRPYQERITRRLDIATLISYQTLMVGLVIIVTRHEPILHQCFEVIFGHTGERFCYGIPGDRYAWKVTMQSNVVGGRQHQMTEELILPPSILLPVGLRAAERPPPGTI